MPNRLIHEKSPYLLQHAHNPVEWYPWGEEAFERARREEKPVFLSIGYSTCHWCHVMEKESFEDPEVAALMNRAFVNIKVDREERPDVDQIYMTACQMTTGSGGWPLTILMTPELRPFFAATYIPKENRYGRVGMKELVPRVEELWRAQREKLIASAEKVADALRRMAQALPGSEAGEEALNQAFEQLSLTYDETHGGFGQSPKFPTPHHLTFLLRYHVRTGRERPLAMVKKTLRQMRLGGVYDQVGFGFHRYATDPAWLVPHFEKMLYDQALLALAYSDAYQLTRDPFYRHTAEEVLAYVLRDMTHPEGGFYASEDADSEGEEGKFYLWKEGELDEHLGKEDGELAKALFRTEPEGNFHEEATRRRTGRNILHLYRPLEESARARGQDVEAFLSRAERIRQTLFSVRERRVRPARDDKILTDWNGLMIAALSRAAFVYDERAYAAAAEHAVAFIEEHLVAEDGGLLHRFRDGEAAIGGFLDDYAFLAWGLIELYEATFDPARLRRACDLAERMIALFWDEGGGGFFFAPAGAEDLIVRPKEIYDGATPAGNSVAAMLLLRLGRMTGSHAYEERGRRTLQALASSPRQSPAAHTHLLQALDFALGPSLEIVLAGPLDRVRPYADVVRAHYLPGKVLLGKLAGSSGEALGALAPFTRNLPAQEAAYVCRGFACEAPCRSPAELEAKLKEGA